jgi:hypothetical protein
MMKLNLAIDRDAWYPSSAKMRSNGGWVMRFTVGLKLNGNPRHVTADGDDALVAALKVKSEHPQARITYVRPMNRRGDARHPVVSLAPELH